MSRATLIFLKLTLHKRTKENTIFNQTAFVLRWFYTTPQQAKGLRANCPQISHLRISLKLCTLGQTHADTVDMQFIVALTALFWNRSCRVIVDWCIKATLASQRKYVFNVKKELARNLDVELSWYMANKAEQERPEIYERILPGWLRTQVNGN